jgi:hypothetical protein
VDQAVELAPARGDLLEHRFELARRLDVERQLDLRPSASASGSTCGRALSLSQVTASSAPASRNALAQP